MAGVLDSASLEGKKKEKIVIKDIQAFNIYGQSAVGKSRDRNKSKTWHIGVHSLGRIQTLK